MTQSDQTTAGESLDRDLDGAMSYRGDVTIHLRGEGGSIDGFVYDRKRNDNPDRSLVRIIPADGSARRSIPVSDIESVAFTGRDTASGKSFETWMKKYVETKLSAKDARRPSDPVSEA